jgi:hypothetical protein
MTDPERERASEPIATETIIAVVSGLATPEERDRVYAASLNDPALRMRIALSLPADTDDADIAEALGNVPVGIAETAELRKGSPLSVPRSGDDSAIGEESE